MIISKSKQILINNVVSISQRLPSSKVSQQEIIHGLEQINIANKLGVNLDVYKGFFILYYYNQYHQYPKIKLPTAFNEYESLFKHNLDIINGVCLLPSTIHWIYTCILHIPNCQGHIRDILLGSFLASLWSRMNDPEKLDIAIKYGVEIIQAAFDFDQFDYISSKIKVGSFDIKTINLSGSGKKDKDTKLLNISSMTSFIIAAASQFINQDIIVAKTSSRATSSTTGSSDIFKLLGVNLRITNQEMAKISSKTKIGVFQVENAVPKLNQIYDNRLYDVQVFAGLVGGAAIVNPVDVTSIHYGLTRGSNKVCLGILNKLYPDKNITVITGKDENGNSKMDQVSIIGETDIAQIINGHTNYYTVTPKDFGLEFGDLNGVLSKSTPEKNAEEFVRLLMGKSNKSLEAVIAMEAAICLINIEGVDNLKSGAKLALEIIKSGKGLEVLDNFILSTKGDRNRLRVLINSIINSKTYD